jgi:hypothetical protein
VSLFVRIFRIKHARHIICVNQFYAEDIEFITFYISSAEAEEEQKEEAATRMKGNDVISGENVKSNQIENIKAQITSNRGFTGFPNNKHFRMD